MLGIRDIAMWYLYHMMHHTAANATNLTMVDQLRWVFKMLPTSTESSNTDWKPRLKFDQDKVLRHISAALRVQYTEWLLLVLELLSL